MAIASALDLAGVAVITGGASGFGLCVAERLVRHGMAVAVLDVSAKELEAAEQRLGEAAAAAGAGAKVLPVRCDVTRFDDCEAAQRAVDAAFPGVPVSFLFNNAGIMGLPGRILQGSPDQWASIFSVNVFGAVHTLKAFLPAMVASGPLPSGKSTFVVTTSSVVGLLNHSTGPYSISKMAVTAVCEQLSIELEDMGANAAHISPHSLHPTVAATSFLKQRDVDGRQRGDGNLLAYLAAKGCATADDIADGLFKGLDSGKHYIIVDHATDVATAQQIAMRMEDQMSGSRPRKPEQLGMLLKSTDKFKERVAALTRASPALSSRL